MGETLCARSGVAPEGSAWLAEAALSRASDDADQNGYVLTVLIVLAATFATAVLSAVAGFGGSVLLLPVFIAVFGTRDAVAVLTVAQLASNGSRVWFNRGDVETKLVERFSFGAVPAAVVGAVIFSTAPVDALTRLIGAFLIVAVLWRRVVRPPRPPSDGAFTLVGAASGLGSALLGSVGPLVAPFFLARGLVRGAYIGTEAASAAVMHITKLVVFGAASVLTLESFGIGVALAPAAAGGAWVGKKILDRLPTAVFLLLVES